MPFKAYCDKCGNSFTVPERNPCQKTCLSCCIDQYRLPYLLETNRGRYIVHAADKEMLMASSVYIYRWTDAGHSHESVKFVYSCIPTVDVSYLDKLDVI